MLAVATVTTWKAVPGKRNEVIQQFKEAKAIHERLGGRVRMWASGMAGPNFGTLTHVIVLDDMAALAKFGEKAQAGPAWLKMVPSLYSDSPGTIVSHSQAVEIV